MDVRVYDTEILTPLVVRFPQGRLGGQRIDRLVSDIDIMPTILRWLGLPAPPRMEGESFAAMVDGATAAAWSGVLGGDAALVGQAL